VACFISFVTEYESRTREFLVNLPVSSFRVGVVKQLTTVSSVAVFFGAQILLRLIVVWLYQTVFDSHGWEDEFRGAASLYVASLVVMAVFVSCMICCSFWSTSWMSVVWALPLAWLLCAACLSYGLVPDSMRDPTVIWGYPRASIVVLALAITGAIAIPLFWLRRRPLLRRWATSSGPSDHAKDDFFWASLPGKLGIKTPALLKLPGRDRFSALCWQSVRQQALMPFLAVVSLGVMVWLFALVLEMSDRGGFSPEVFKPMQVALLFVMTMTGYGFGAAALYRDKLNSNLSFFQQHKEYGRELLLARVLLPLLLLVATMAVGHCIITWFTGVATDIWLPLLSGLSGFSVMLMWSMAFRSHIYALAIGLMLALTMNGFISIWQGNDGFEYRWMAVLPFVWLITCFAYAPTWLSGRRGARWMAWFTFVSILTYAVPLWGMTCWLLGMEPTA